MDAVWAMVEHLMEGVTIVMAERVALEARIVAQDKAGQVDT